MLSVRNECAHTYMWRDYNCIISPFPFLSPNPPIYYPCSLSNSWPFSFVVVVAAAVVLLLLLCVCLTKYINTNT